MDRELREAAAAWLDARIPAVVVEVVQARGSAPRDAGARLLVSAVQALGTIGGGHLEWQALATARAMLAAGERAPRRERQALGPALGQCCGGVVELAFATLDTALLARWPLPAPLFHLQLYGGGHVGRAIATLLATLDVTVEWIDERDDAFGPTTTLGTPWPRSIRRIAVDACEAEVALAPPWASYLVLTHDHALDFRIVEAVLQRDDIGFLGLIGSRSKRERFLHRLARRGADAAQLARLCCPIGVTGIGGKQPELIALAAVAQLVQVASARAPAGGSLTRDARLLRTTA